jgi:3-methylcrotonyl-CoA carboxylase alpha subunit
VLGVETNLPLLRAIAAHPDFEAGQTFTDFLTSHDLSAQLERSALPLEALLAAAALDVVAPPERASAAEKPRAVKGGRPFNPWTQGGAWRQGGEQTFLYTYASTRYQMTLTPQTAQKAKWDVRIAAKSDGKQEEQNVQTCTVALARPTVEMVAIQLGERRGLAAAVQRGYDTLVSWQGMSYRLERPRPLDVDVAAAGATVGAVQQKLTAPMPGTIVKVHVREGDQVQARQTLLVLSAMKMEHAITAPHAAVVRRLPFAEGAAVPGGATLVELGEAEADQANAGKEESNGAF